MDFRTLNAILAISKAPETALNTIKRLAAEFDGAVTSALNVGLPNIEKIGNEALIGSGNEWETDFINDYLGNPSITFSDRLNTKQFALLSARHLGGTITSTEVGVGSGVFDHVIQMMASDVDPTPKASTVAGKFGGLDLILGGMICNSLGIGYGDNQLPTYTAELLGTGYYERMADQTPPLVLPAPVSQNYTGSAAAIVCQLNDGSLLDLSAVGRLQSFNLQSSINVDLGDRRPGDPFITSGDIESGAYTPRASRGTRDVQVTVGVYNNENRREWNAHLDNVIINNLTWKAVGRKIAATAHSHEIEVTIPESIIRAVSLGDNREKQILQLTFNKLKKTTETGIWKLRIRNASATLA